MNFKKYPPVTLPNGVRGYYFEEQHAEGHWHIGFVPDDPTQDRATPDPNGAHNIDLKDLGPPSRRFEYIVVVVTLALIGAFFVFAA